MTRLILLAFLLGTGLSTARAESASLATRRTDRLIELAGSSEPMEGVIRDRFEYRNTTTRPLYYRTCAGYGSDPAGQPAYGRSYRRSFVWSAPEHPAVPVQAGFKRLDPGKTLAFDVTHPVSFWRWRVDLHFYSAPKETATPLWAESVSVHH